MIKTDKNNLTLGDLVNFKRGYDLPHRDRKDGNVPIMSSSGLTGWHKYSMVKAPGVITGRYGTLGEVFYVDNDYWPLNTSLYVQNFKGNNPKFIYYYLKAVLNESFNSAGAVPGVNRNYLHKIKVPQVPKEQNKFAAILSAYDDQIKNNERRIALLEKMAEEIYKEWFVRMRFPGCEKVTFEKGVPKNWDIRTIDDLSKEIRAGVSKKDLAGDENYLGLEHIPRKSIAIQQYTTADTVDSNKLLFKERDILFSKIRPYLHKVALAHFSGACSTDTIVIRPNEAKYEGYLLFTVFSESFIELATIASKGTKMPRADWDFLKKLELAVPSTELLRDFQDKFEVIFSQIVNQLNSNRILTATRNRLLNRLISGKLSVENLDIQFPPGMQEAESSVKDVA